MFRLFGADGVNILVHRVCRALVPLFTHSLHRRQYFDELSHLASQNVPALADVPVQRQRLVLGENVDSPQVRVDAIGEGDIDDAVDAAEGDGRFRPVARQGIESLPRPSRQQNSQGVFHLASAWMTVRPFALPSCAFCCRSRERAKKR